MQLEDRKIKEIEHSDRRRSIVRANEYLTDTATDKLDRDHVAAQQEYETHFSNMKFYSVTRSSVAERDRLLFEKTNGATVLDYCCGNGEMAIEMVKHGAKKAMGIDISEVAIENARKLSQSQGVGERCDFRVMDAEHTQYPADTFDVIHEYGALHHLDLRAAYKELSRILKPTGRLVCTETMRHNPLIRWYRNRTPHLRTVWEVEHILGVPEIESGREFFGKIKKRHYHLAVLAAVPFRKAFFFRPLLAVLEAVDAVILRIPYFRRLGWIVVVEYSEPK